MNYPEGYVQKGDNQKVAILEESHSQSFFYITQRSIQKVKRDMTKSKKSAKKFEKLVNLQQLFFFFCNTFTC